MSCGRSEISVGEWRLPTSLWISSGDRVELGTEGSNLLASSLSHRRLDVVSFIVDYR